MMERVQNLFRPAYEARSAVAWMVSTVYVLLLAVFVRVSVPAIAGMLAVSITMATWRAYQVRKLWNFKLAISGKEIQLLPAHRFESARQALGDNLWLGWGYRWEPKHAQLCYEILKRNADEVYPPDWFRKWNGIKTDPKTAKGHQWIQGLDAEKDVVVPFKALEGHTAILAITGAIKTTLFKLLVYQLASRGDVVVVLDPKGDADLKQICRDVPAALGTPERFAMFHPAFPSQSFRFDAFAAWDRETQVASRIQMIMAAGEDNNFISFVWMTVTNIVGCMKRIGQRTSIKSLLEHVQSQETAEALCEKVLERYLIDLVPHFETIIAERVRDSEAAAAKPTRGKTPAITSPRLVALISFFKSELKSGDRPQEITGLIAALEANREWFGKMIITLTPTLTKLSNGDLGALLSPNYEDIEDERQILNSRKIIEGGYVAYFGLDALSDPSVAAAIAAVTVADFAGTAGEIYNYDIPANKGKPPRKVHILIDEWGDAVCEPVIQLANKARGAGVVLYLAGQTFSDLVVKMGGNVNMAKRIIGNMNNMIVGATNDSDTLEIISEKFGETAIRKANLSQGAGQKTEDTGLEYSGNRSVSLSETAGELVPRNVIMGLPDLQYFAMVNRAAIYKGRIPVMTLGGA